MCVAPGTWHLAPGTWHMTHILRVPRILWTIVLTYLAVATLFALYTPAWQVPDEPAHYNYVRHLALGHGLPVLEAGDYCQKCIEDLAGKHFPPGMPIDGLQYEFHAPPLYYALAVPVFGHEPHAVPDGFAWRLEGDAPAVELDCAGVEAIGAEDRLQYLGAFGADETGDADDLAGVQIEADVAEHALSAQPRHA